MSTKSNQTAPPPLHVRVEGEANRRIREIRLAFVAKQGMPASLDTIACAIVDKGIPAFCNFHGLEIPAKGK